MEIKFEKTILPYMRTVARQVQSQEQTQQVRLPDAMPDIDKILTSWGQVILRSKEWRTGCVQVSGGVTVRVLYIPKDQIQPKCVEAWLPFHISYDIPDTQQDGVIVACPFLRSLDARTLSDRKLLLRATVGVSMDAIVPDETYLYTPQSAPKDVQLLSNSYPMQIPMESGEKQFNLEEPLDFVKPDQTINVLRCNLEPMLLESKIIADKLVMRGKADVDMLYIDAEGAIQKKHKEVPFSQYTQLSGEYDPDTLAEICFAITDLELEQSENAGYVLKAGILAQYTIYGTKSISVVEDAYSPQWKLEIASESLQLPAVLDRKEQVMQPEAELNLPEHQVLDVTFFVDDLHSEFAEDVLSVNPSGTFQVLSADMEGNLHNTMRKWEGKWKLQASPEIAANISAIPEGSPMIVGQNISLPLRLKLVCAATQPIPMISDIHIAEAITPNPGRPSIILRRMGNETLWQMAKSTGSTVSAIKEANGLKQEPDKGQFLLIPIN